MKQFLFIAALLALMAACKDDSETTVTESTNEFAPPTTSVLEKALEPPLATDKLPADLMPPV